MALCILPEAYTAVEVSPEVKHLLVLVRNRSITPAIFHQQWTGELATERLGLVYRFSFKFHHIHMQIPMEVVELNVTSSVREKSIMSSIRIRFAPKPFRISRTCSVRDAFRHEPLLCRSILLSLMHA